MNTDKKYYKHPAESDLGKGNVLMEARGEKILRQVEVYGLRAVWSDASGQSDDRFLLADQPLSFFDFDEDDSQLQFDFAMDSGDDAPDPADAEMLMEEVEQFLRDQDK